MPVNSGNNEGSSRGRRTAFSVVEVAKFCRLSRARFYDLIASGVMPPPVYSTKTRQPLYTAELAARCVEVRETNTGLDGSYVMFYERRASSSPQPAVLTAPVTPRRRQTVLDPLTQEMIEALRSMGITATEAAMVEAIQRRCPGGVTEATFERDLLGLYGDLRRPTGV